MEKDITCGAAVPCINYEEKSYLGIVSRINKIKDEKMEHSTHQIKSSRCSVSGLYFGGS